MELEETKHIPSSGTFILQRWPVLWQKNNMGQSQHGKENGGKNDKMYENRKKSKEKEWTMRFSSVAFCTTVNFDLCNLKIKDK